MQSLTHLLGDARALNICRDRDGNWQASLEVSMGTFRIGIGATPDDALEELRLRQPVMKPPY